MPNATRSSGERETGDGHREGQSLAKIRPGTLIEGKYLVDRVIGRGGMGVVLAAKHVELNKRVALKFLEVKDDEMPGDFDARFALEARVCAKLKNSHIARVHDVSVWQGKYPFMVMDYLEGEDLRRRLKEKGKLPLALAVDYAVQICDGLAEAHAQGIIHRDLKPPNIFITRQHDGSELVKVLDFGISKWSASGEGLGELTKTGVMLGSPKYMSPEQLNGDTVDARSDIWSIGAILYGMLTGQPPFDFPQVTQTFLAIASGTPPVTPSTLEPSIPQAIDAVILRCMARERGERIANVAELAGALLEAIGAPFAKQVRAQIAAVLDPNGASALRPGFSTVTTGSHAVFSLPSNRAPATGEVSTLPAPPESTTPGPLAASKPRHARRPWWGFRGWAALVVAIAAIASRTTPESSGSAGASARARSVAVKQVVSERASLLAPPPPVVEVAAPAVHASPRSEAPARSPRAIPASHREAVLPPDPAAPTLPAAHAGSRPTSTANALDDRQ